MKIIASIIFLFVSLFLTAQNQENIEFSLYGSIPYDFNKQYRSLPEQPVVVVPSIVGRNTGYDYYNKLGCGLIVEYTKQIKSKFYIKAGANIILHTSYKESYDKNLSLSSNFILYPSEGNNKYYKSNNYNYYAGISLGLRYLIAKKHSVFFDFSLNYITFSYHKRINWLNEEIKFWQTVRLNGILDYVFYKFGYIYDFSEKISAFTLVEINDLYFGLGIKYKLSLK